MRKHWCEENITQRNNTDCVKHDDRNEGHLKELNKKVTDRKKHERNSEHPKELMKELNKKNADLVKHNERTEGHPKEQLKELYNIERGESHRESEWGRGEYYHKEREGRKYDGVERRRKSSKETLGKEYHKENGREKFHRKKERGQMTQDFNYKIRFEKSAIRKRMREMNSTLRRKSGKKKPHHQHRERELLGLKSPRRGDLHATSRKELYQPELEGAPSHPAWNAIHQNTWRGSGDENTTQRRGARHPKERLKEFNNNERDKTHKENYCTREENYQKGSGSGWRKYYREEKGRKSKEDTGEKESNKEDRGKKIHKESGGEKFHKERGHMTQDFNHTINFDKSDIRRRKREMNVTLKRKFRKKKLDHQYCKRKLLGLKSPERGYLKPSCRKGRYQSKLDDGRSIHVWNALYQNIKRGSSDENITHRKETIRLKEQTKENNQKERGKYHKESEREAGESQKKEREARKCDGKEGRRKSKKVTGGNESDKETGGKENRKENGGVKFHMEKERGDMTDCCNHKINFEESGTERNREINAILERKSGKKKVAHQHKERKLLGMMSPVAGNLKPSGRKERCQSKLDDDTLNHAWNALYKYLRRGSGDENITHRIEAEHLRDLTKEINQQERGKSHKDWEAGEGNLKEREARKCDGEKRKGKSDDEMKETGGKKSRKENRGVKFHLKKERGHMTHKINFEESGIERITDMDARLGPKSGKKKIDHQHRERKLLGMKSPVESNLKPSSRKERCQPKLDDDRSNHPWNAIYQYIRRGSGDENITHRKEAEHLKEPTEEINQKERGKSHKDWEAGESKEREARKCDEEKRKGKSADEKKETGGKKSRKENIGVKFHLKKEKGEKLYLKKEIGHMTHNIYFEESGIKRIKVMNPTLGLKSGKKKEDHQHRERKLLGMKSHVERNLKPSGRKERCQSKLDDDRSNHALDDIYQNIWQGSGDENITHRKKAEHLKEPTEEINQKERGKSHKDWEAGENHQKEREPMKCDEEKRKRKPDDENKETGGKKSRKENIGVKFHLKKEKGEKLYLKKEIGHMTHNIYFEESGIKRIKEMNPTLGLKSGKKKEDHQHRERKLLGMKSHVERNLKPSGRKERCQSKLDDDRSNHALDDIYQNIWQGSGDENITHRKKAEHLKEPTEEINQKERGKSHKDWEAGENHQKEREPMKCDGEKRKRKSANEKKETGVKKSRKENRGVKFHLKKERGHMTHKINFEEGGIERITEMDATLGRTSGKKKIDHQHRERKLLGMKSPGESNLKPSGRKERQSKLDDDISNHPWNTIYQYIRRGSGDENIAHRKEAEHLKEINQKERGKCHKDWEAGESNKKEREARKCDGEKRKRKSNDQKKETGGMKIRKESKGEIFYLKNERGHMTDCCNHKINFEESGTERNREMNATLERKSGKKKVAHRHKERKLLGMKSPVAGNLKPSGRKERCQSKLDDNRSNDACNALYQNTKQDSGDESITHQKDAENLEEQTKEINQKERFKSHEDWEAGESNQKEREASKYDEKKENENSTMK
ncbi:hypothetical protein GE061_011621 [Apolygus lucorum]|uniref:Uncharacterized protein n=1 Tax=Apolygus lucorum TaxID=248454 RepID=A0A8S9Y0N8_APOLU|nr:hypothetical protein GE061_011621 [Apolygus lucorum]